MKMKYELWKIQGDCPGVINKVYPTLEQAQRNMIQNYTRYLRELKKSAEITENYIEDKKCLIRYKLYNSEDQWVWEIRES